MKTYHTFFAKTIIVSFTLFFTFTNVSFTKPHKTDNKLALKSFIEKNGKAPSQYIIDKFKTKDIVVLSEFNRLKHEVDFVRSMISTLYNNGIYTLAMEFGNSQDQEKVNKLLRSESYNKESAIDILRNFNEYGIWGYQEYLDIFRTAWEVNQLLLPSSPRFEILLLSNSKGYGKGKNKTQYMAEIIENNIISKGKKALVYVTSNHAENHLVCLDSKTINQSGFPKDHCLASVLKAKNNQKIFSVLFHSPWAVIAKNEIVLTGVTKPLDGEIDAAFELMSNNPVAFDILESPIKDFSEKRSIYYEMNKDYTIKCICDGYIYLKPYEEYEYVTWNPNFINEDYLKLVKDYYKKINPDLKIETVEYANDICGAAGYSILGLVKGLKSSNFVELISEKIQKGQN